MPIDKDLNADIDRFLDEEEWDDWEDDFDDWCEEQFEIAREKRVFGEW